MLSNFVKMSAIAGLMALGTGVMVSQPASAATYETHCDRFGGECYRVRCNDFGDDCVRVYDEDRTIERTAYRHWYCDGDGCRWTYSENYRPYHSYDEDWDWDY